jgi:hypothetical protein
MRAPSWILASASRAGKSAQEGSYVRDPRFLGECPVAGSARSPWSEPVALLIYPLDRREVRCSRDAQWNFHKYPVGAEGELAGIAFTGSSISTVSTAR